MANQYGIDLKTRTAIIDYYDETRGFLPKVSMDEIAEKFGVYRTTVTNTIKNRDAYLKRAQHSPRKTVQPQDRHIVLVIPDLHCPWEHPDSLQFLLAVQEKYQTTITVNLGDEVDFYGMSRFSHDPDVMSPGHELSDAVRHLLPFYKSFPEMLVCQSNHTHRVHKKAADSGLPRGTIKSIEEILRTPEGWKYKQKHVIDGVEYKHGAGKSGENAHKNHAKATGKSTAIGHIHAHGGVAYLNPRVFAVNGSCLIDKSAPCFAYASDLDDNIVHGCAVVYKGKAAHFIRMFLDENDRWTGEVW